MGTQFRPCHRKGHSSPPPSFRSMYILAKRSPISAIAEHLLFYFTTLFGRPFVKTVRPTVSDHCVSYLSCLFSCLLLCDFGTVLRPNGWMDHDETWHAGRSRHWPHHIVLDGDPAAPLQKGTLPQIFGPYLLWPNGWMSQDATW